MPTKPFAQPNTPLPRRSRCPAWRRAGILEHIAHRIEHDALDLARGIALEAGKPLSASRAEVERAVQTFRVAAEEAKRIGGELLPLDWTAGNDHRAGLIRRFPIGPILGITPFNFPLNLVAHKLAPAIASGNPIIIKPAPQTPLTALRLGEMAVGCRLAARRHQRAALFERSHSGHARRLAPAHADLHRQRRRWAGN